MDNCSGFVDIPLSNEPDGIQKAKIKPASYEDVAQYLGFGKFNVFLITLITPAMFCNVFETTTLSYIFTSAKCDLNITMQMQGVMNSIVYSGMIVSALVWGYLGDTLGRKRIIMIGLFLDAMLILISVLSQNIIMLLICKFFGGFIINGPFAALTTYISEFHSSKYRAMIQLYYGCMISVGFVLLPLIAWGVLMQTWEIEIFGYLKIHSWNIFLFFTSFPALIGVVCLSFLPESPKFLMTIGDNKAAMKVFKQMYTLNTGKPSDTFPFKELQDEKKLDERQREDYENRSKLQIMRDGLKQIKPLFEITLFSKLILVCLLQIFMLQGLNMIRLWTPQILQAYEVYKENHNGTSTHFCNALEILKDDPSESDGADDFCLQQNEHSGVYINSIIISSVNTLFYAISGTVLKLIGKNKLLIISEVIASASALGMYFAPNEIVTTVLIMIFTSLQIMSSMMNLSIVVDVFPTTLRTLTVSIVMMMGRTCVVIGNLIFPFLLAQGCAVPFVMVGALCLTCAILYFFVPNTDNKALE